MAAQDEQKHAVALAAVEQVRARLAPGAILGVGSGTTVDHFIDALAPYRDAIGGTVSSSERSARHLRDRGFAMVDLNDVDTLALCVDGADEIDGTLAMIKGGGAALTREKIVAAVARVFICVVDASKRVDVLGRFPLPIEVIPFARAYVARELGRLGGRPVWRSDCVTDNGNVILDVHDLRIDDPVALENRIDQIAGVVTCGIFARRRADLLLVATETGVELIEP
jgi:ribose 5-phosphate isomerase A